MLALLFAIAALGAASASTTTDPASEDRSLDELLVWFSDAQASIETLQCRFEERKDLSLFKEPVIQRGNFYHSRPQNYLWDYDAPTPKKILLTSDILLAYYPDIKRAEEVNVRHWTRKIRRYLQVGSDLDALREDYDIALSTDGTNEIAGTYLLILEPRARNLKSRLDDIRLWVDRDTGFTRQVAYREAKGDQTVFTFLDIQVNAEINPARFHIELPKDVRMGASFSGFSGK